MISSSFSYSSSLSASRTIALPMSHVSLVESDGLISCIYIFSRDKSDSIEINTAVFLGKMCSGRHKNHDCGLNKPEGTSSAMFDVGTAAKCYEFKRYVLQLDSMLRELSELRELLTCGEHGCFSRENGFGPSQKPWLWTENN